MSEITKSNDKLTMDRIGRFRISGVFLQQMPQWLLDSILARMDLMRVSPSIEDDFVEYFGRCDLFDEVDVSEPFPEYLIHYDTEKKDFGATRIEEDIQMVNGFGTLLVIDSTNAKN